VAGAGLGGAHAELDSGAASLFGDLDDTELGGSGSAIIEQGNGMVAPFGMSEEVGLEAGGGEVEGEVHEYPLMKSVNLNSVFTE
jgi:hypothetical protein